MEILRTRDDLARFLDEAREHGPLALDMEFERERTYRPILQLLQLAHRDRAVLVDPLEIDDLSPVWEAVADPEREILLHAGGQDMEIVWDQGNVLPRRIFDTQVAAALLGMGEQPGYADLVRRILKVKLQKGERTTNWGKRPLTEAQMQYALDDVLHLHGLYDELVSQLEARGRLPWLREECLSYESSEAYDRDPDTLWLRVARHRSLRGAQLAVLRELAKWREEAAARRNIPRNRVVPDDVLLDIARRNPDRAEELKQLRRLHPREIEKSGDRIMEAVERGRSLPRDEWPRVPRIPDDDPERNATVDLVATYLKLRCRELDIAPSYIATRKELHRMVQEYRPGRELPDARPLVGWRMELVGHDLVSMLQGKVGISVDPETVLVTIVEGEAAER